MELELVGYVEKDLMMMPIQVLQLKRYMNPRNLQQFQEHLLGNMLMMH